MTHTLRLLAVVAIGAICVAADRLTISASPQDRPLFSTESALVVLHVTVRDKQGRYIGGLSKDSFDVSEDGKPQAIPFFTAEDAPVTVGLLIDTSGSMQANRDLVVAASSLFAERSNPRDEFFALTFNDDVRAALPGDRPFTRDGNLLRDALADTIAIGGRTALYDAIGNGIDYLSGGQYERKALVVISDGGDNASVTTFEQTLDRLRASNVVLDAVSLVDPDETDSNPKRLGQLAEASGGVAFRPRDRRDVRDALERVAVDIRSAYTMGYTPLDSTPAGFRRIRVTVRAPNLKAAVVRTRSGYLASPQSQGRGHGN